MPHENMFFAESHMMEKLSDRHVDHAARQLRPPRAAAPAATETVVVTSRGGVARVSQPVAAGGSDHGLPVVAEGVELLASLSEAQRLELLRGTAEPPSTSFESASSHVDVSGRALPPWVRRSERNSASSVEPKRKRAKRPQSADTDHSRLSFADGPD